MKTSITKRAPNRFRSGLAQQPLNGVQQLAPSTASPGPIPYTPAAEAMRPVYERIAATFLDLYDWQFDSDTLLQIESDMEVPQTDFVAVIDQHLHSLFDEVDLSDRRILPWLYTHLRLIVDTQKARRGAA